MVPNFQVCLCLEPQKESYSTGQVFWRVLPRQCRINGKEDSIGEEGRLRADSRVTLKRLSSIGGQNRSHDALHADREELEQRDEGLDWYAIGCSVRHNHSSEDQEQEQRCKRRNDLVGGNKRLKSQYNDGVI